MVLTTRSDFGRSLLSVCMAQKRKRAPFFQLKGRQMAVMTRGNMVINSDQHQH